ncbi:hypothetical protein D7Z26_05405 [Cohnella endophytica]|uniref:Polymer-forming cytoskeletal protein n=1 Tax=Cohnella endophytica TaxID=2419778 RepID=A0A494XZZ7_9BACL|nr:hypothetical protein [Cohnella endophytica]RKP56089.1 hypothetical protein D7Z26_05405 [Cohnella endophytica]
MAVGAGKPDLIINGVSNAGGGEYSSVKVDGVGTVNGDVSAVTFDANGVTKVRGNLVAEEIDCDGIMKVKGDLIAGRSVVDGNIKIEGAVKGDRLSVNGILNVGKECELETLEMEGAFNIGGFLNAGQLNVRLHGKGRAQDIGVESIKVRQASKSKWNILWRWMLPRFSPELETNSIEGDEIDLEYTEANVVRGSRVFIGKGCVIGTVEYRTELKVHPGAKIGKEVKTGG